MSPIAYEKITHHGRRVVQCLQTPDDRVLRTVKMNGAVIEAPAPLRALRPLRGVEVGVHRGRNAATLLARCPNLTLYLVDHWGQTPEEADADPVGHPFYREMLEETAFAADRRVILRRGSPAAAALVPDELDFVFVDGDHLYEPCLADLEAWWPKIRSGGMMLGHDIDNLDPKYADWGVRRAVEEFCAARGLEFDVYPFPEMVFAIRKP